MRSYSPEAPKTERVNRGWPQGWAEVGGGRQPVNLNMDWLSGNITELLLIAILLGLIMVMVLM